MFVDTLSERDTVNIERVAFDALDGFPLGGFLHATQTCASPRMAAIFAGGDVRVAGYKDFLCAPAARPGCRAKGNQLYRRAFSLDQIADEIKTSAIARWQCEVTRPHWRRA